MADTVQKIIEVQFKDDKALQGLSNLNKAIDENRAKMREMAKNGEKSSQTYAQLEQHTKALTKAKQDLTREVQNEVKMQTQEKGSLTALRAELSNLTAQYDKLKREKRETSQAGKQLQQQINSVTTEIKKAEEGTQRYYRNVGNYQNAILNAVGLNNQFGQSLIGITTAEQGVSGAFAAMGASARAFGKTLLSLAANPVFLALAGIVGAGMAFKWFYDYNVGVEQALRLTREFTGVTGRALDELRIKIQATADTYGKEYKETLEAVDLLMSHYHMSGTQAIETINKGFQAGADINGTYLQNLKQYAPTFHDAGIAADEMVAIITQTRSGIFSQQGLDAIRMGSARIREMSNTTRQALQGIGIDVDEMQRKLTSGQLTTFGAIKQVSEELKKLPDNAQQVGEVMTAVFGRQGKFASQEMIENIATMSTDLDELKKKTGDYGTAIDDNRKATEDLERAMSNMFGTGERGWETLTTTADTFWKRTLANCINGVTNLSRKIAKLYQDSTIFRNVAKTISAAMYGFFGAIVAGFKNIGQGFKSIGAWVDAFVETFKSAFGVIKGLGLGLADILTGNITKGINEVTGAMNKGVNNTLKKINTALKETGKIVNNFAAPFVAGWNAPDTFLGSYTESGGSVFGGGSFGAGSGTGGTGGTSGGSGSGSGGSSGKSGGRRGSNRSGGSSGKSPEQQEIDRLRDYYNKRMQLARQLASDAAAVEKRALQEKAKEGTKEINALYDAQEREIRAKYEALGLLTTDEKDALQKLIDDNNKKRADALQKYEEEQQRQTEEARRKANDQAKQLAQASLDSSDDGSLLQMKWRLEVLRMEMEAELAMVEQNEQLKAAIRAKYEKQATEIMQENAQKQREIESTKYEAISTVVGGIGDLFGAFGEQSKEFAVLQKTLALGEIMISQAVAIANAVKAGSNAVTPWQMIAQIATSIVAVTTAMAQAFAALDSAKFATGGYIRGAGTGTSDSIPVRVSNGESVMTANTTAMFSGLLSSLNQLGGGVPIQATNTAKSVQGEDMLARAVAKGVAMLPAPVVSVQDINRGQRQVEVTTERARL